MKQRVVLVLGLFLFIFTFLSFALLAGQNSRIERREEMLFRSREELILAQNRINEEEQRVNTLSREVGRLSGENKAHIILTFDDGPSSITGPILDILEKENIPAVFFINGVNVSAGRVRLIKRAVAEGHIIGNHTYSHDYDRIYRSVDDFMEDFLKNEELIWKWTGTRSMLVRFPGGSRNSLCATEEGRQLMEDLKYEMDRRGYLYMDWNVTDPSNDPQEVLHSLEDQILWRDSATILLHDRGDRAFLVEILPSLIKTLKEEGYEFVLPERFAGAVRF
ncbi:MAG: polysaccharide deacetylase [Spirochaetales bacterium]|nr:polysaccharide deacetylase [Spirochaetales bacterium]